MARIEGIAPDRAPLWLRPLYWFGRRAVNKLTGRASVVTPLQVHAHHARLFIAVAQMEMGQNAAKAVSAKLKSLAGIRAASLVGCPF